MDTDPEELVTRRQAGKECGGRHPRTIKRWEDRKILGFDEPIRIGACVFHKRSRLALAKGGVK